MTVFICVPAFGPWAVTLAWTLWWVDVVISVACCMFMPFAMYVVLVSTPPEAIPARGVLSQLDAELSAIQQSLIEYPECIFTPHNLFKP
jgi:hypothetical protein